MKFEERFWKIELVGAWLPGIWPYNKVYKATCPNCGLIMLLPRSLKRRNRYGSMPCPVCWVPSRIPGAKRTKQLRR